MNIFATQLALGASLMLAVAAESIAAPIIMRVTPPPTSDASLAAGGDYVSRFLPGQRFDLHATVLPDTGTFVTNVKFEVDGKVVGSILGSDTKGTATYTGNASLVPATTLTATYPGAASAYLRAYSTTVTGKHTITVTASTSTGALTTATGNFEVVKLANASGTKAKNVIILLGDGMGAAHRTAARIVSKGVLSGKSRGVLAMDTFPYTGMVRTASLDSVITDSAPGMQNYVTGNKARNNQEGVWPDDTSDKFDNPRFEYLSEYLYRTRKTSLGVVTTADVFDATPASMAIHTSDRGAGSGIVDQFLDDSGLTGLTVLMGGGRKWFLPNTAGATAAPTTPTGTARTTSTDYVLPSDLVAGWGAAVGKKDAERDLIADFKSAGFTYASNKTELTAAGTPSKLLGLFAYSNMNVAYDKINGRRGKTTVVNDYGFPDQPMLDEMTNTALNVLSKNKSGFVLLVEGASIDKQSHNMDATRAIVDTIEFDRAVAAAKAFAAKNPDTLVIVTADHECSGFSIIGTYKSAGATPSANDVAVYQGNSVNDVAGTNLNFPIYTNESDGYPSNMDIANRLMIGFGANVDRYETWTTAATPVQDSQQPFVKVAPLSSYPASAVVRNASVGFLVSGQVGNANAGEQAVHTGADVPLSAFGAGSQLFTGNFENSDVFFKIISAAGGK